jgi:hypothetical protein
LDQVKSGTPSLVHLNFVPSWKANLNFPPECFCSGLFALDYECHFKAKTKVSF